MGTVNKNKVIKDHRSTKELTKYLSVADITPLAAKCRAVLSDSLESRFAKSYMEPNVRMDCSYICEIQFFLRLQLKNLDRDLERIICFSNLQRGAVPDTGRRIAQAINTNIIDKMRQMMLAIACNAASRSSRSRIGGC